MQNVSRETSERLEAYVAELLKWNKKINLIGRSTQEDVWNRHIIDSIQVFEAATDAKTWADVGSGAGLPGLVVAILAKERAPEMKTILIESDIRKGVFCRSVARSLDLDVIVRSERIEESEPCMADVVSARALAPLNVLLSYAKRHTREGGLAIFPKGAGWKKEITESLASWRFSVEKIPSVTDPSAVILKIGDINRV